LFGWVGEDAALLTPVNLVLRSEFARYLSDQLNLSVNKQNLYVRSSERMVKYADGPTTTAEVYIDASPSTVWPFLCDINAPAAFSHEFQGADWLDSDGPALGATFRGRNQHKVVGDWSAVCTVTVMEHERAFEWTVGDIEYRAARWRFDLEPDGAGSRLTFTAEIGPAPSGLTPAIERMPDREEDIIAKRMGEHNTNMQRTLEGYKELAEQSEGQ